MRTYARVIVVCISDMDNTDLFNSLVPFSVLCSEQYGGRWHTWQLVILYMFASFRAAFTLEERCEIARALMCPSPMEDEKLYAVEAVVAFVQLMHSSRVC